MGRDFIEAQAVNQIDVSLRPEKQRFGFGFGLVVGMLRVVYFVVLDFVEFTLDYLCNANVDRFVGKVATFSLYELSLDNVH